MRCEGVVKHERGVDWSNEMRGLGTRQPDAVTWEMGARRQRWGMVRLFLLLATAGLALAGCNMTSPAPPSEAAGLPCAPGTKCLKVNSNGEPAPDGTSVAQCSGTFPDFVVEADLFPADYKGPWFELAQNFPTELKAEELPWTKIDFRRGKKEADAYLYALRDYAFDGMIFVDFRPQDNKKRAWFHVPLMNYGPGRREFVHGLTQERPLTGPELGLRKGVSVSNFAIGFYNALGGYAFGEVWQNPDDPALAKSRFQEGAMVFKILFTAATRGDFQDPNNYIVEGAPEWQAATGKSQLTTVRLLQMDVAVRDNRAGKTGWVFGTFAFDKDATDKVAWRRMRPVGLMWGNDPGYTPDDQKSGKPLKEGIISDKIPAYAAAHLGWAGRLNGPVDNPISACMSCHSTAQYPVDAQLAPFSSSCKSDKQKLHWFRDLAGNVAFGMVDKNTCDPGKANPPPVALDYSLQMQVAVQSLLQYKDVNSSMAADEGARTLVSAPERTGSPARTTKAERVVR